MKIQTTHGIRLLGKLLLYLWYKNHFWFYLAQITHVFTLKTALKKLYRDINMKHKSWFEEWKVMFIFFLFFFYSNNFMLTECI